MSRLSATMTILDSTRLLKCNRQVSENQSIWYNGNVLCKNISGHSTWMESIESNWDWTGMVMNRINPKQNKNNTITTSTVL